MGKQSAGRELSGGDANSQASTNPFDDASVLSDAALRDLIAAERLPVSYAEAVARCWRPLAARIAEAARVADGAGLLVGINGPQGAGKSTACVFLEALLAENHATRAVTLSLDDVYLDRATRAALARSVHPLFRTRGPPGTHDVALAAETVEALLRDRRLVALPRFNKATDDPTPRSAWPRVQAPVDVVLFEGWCVGAAPQPPQDLAAPVNSLEAREDADGVWRAAANARLASDYRDLFARIDLLVMLRPSGFARVAAWRGLQEAKLRSRTGGGMDDAALARFVQHYERLTAHALREMPGRADWIVPIDDDHRPGAPMRGPGPGSRLDADARL